MAGISVQNLKKSYKGRDVVKGVSLEVGKGEVVGLLGPNGAGKTTTFYMTVGLIRPDGGTVTCKGKDITNMPMYKRARLGISYLPQEASVFKKLTVEENLMAIIEFLDVSKEERKELLEKHLEDLSITHIRKSYGYALSGGERRRVEIARALVNRPDILLLDEPFAGIDPIAVGDIQDIVVELKGKGIGVLITDHNVSAALGICDRAYIIESGRILESGSPEEIATSENVRKVYLGENFKL